MTAKAALAIRARMPKVYKRFASDYSADELATFRQQFEPVARRHRLVRRIAIVCIAPFFFSMVCFGRFAVVFFGIVFLIALYEWITTPEKRCPACDNLLEYGLGEFCPECGSRSLRPGDWFTAPR